MDRLPNDIWLDPGLDGKYLFEGQIATSAMAVVVVARHLELDERVAIKFLSPEALRSSAAVTRFRCEAKAAAKIKSQHVVRIIDVATTRSGVPYIVMEFLDGRDLERLLSQYPGRQAPVGDAVDFVLQASEAVIEGHTLGIVHRDLKPANLFCVDRGDGYPMIKVLDFGISKFSASIGEVERTDRHEILGSPRYMSPEQIESACSVDQRTDIWALGTILYEAIGGRAPFNQELIPELWRRIRHEAPEPLPTLRRDCPLELWEVVAKCLQKDPADRYDDLGQLAKALAPMAPERSRASVGRICWTAEVTSQGTCRLSQTTTDRPRVLTHPNRGRLRWAVPAGLAVIVGAGVSAVSMRRVSKLSEARELALTLNPESRALGRGSPSRSSPLIELAMPTAIAASASTFGASASAFAQPSNQAARPPPHKSTAIARTRKFRPAPPNDSTPVASTSASPSSAPSNNLTSNKASWPMEAVVDRK